MKNLIIISYFFSTLAFGKGAFREATPQEQIQKYGNCTKLAEIPQTFNLISWNMLTGLKKKWPEAFEEYQKSNDLVLLQETYFDKWRSDIFNQTKKCWVGGTAHVHIKTNIPSGVATGTIGRPIRQEVTYSKYYEPIMWVRQSTLYTWYKIQNSKKELLVVNIHAINFVGDDQYFEQLANIEIKIRKHKGPLILAGDFNTFTLSKTKFVNLIALKHKLNQVTFSNDIRRKFSSYPLDHIYVRGFDILSSDSLDSRLSSDHNAIIARLKYHE